MTARALLVREPAPARLALGAAARPPRRRPRRRGRSWSRRFYPLWEFARQVAGDRAEVVSLVPPGVEPHDWEPSPQDVSQVRRAAVFVYNGAGFELGR